jgi:hypothetical protein
VHVGQAEADAGLGKDAKAGARGGSVASGQYEKELMSAVVRPEDMEVSFDDIGALEGIKALLHEVRWQADRKNRSTGGHQGGARDALIDSQMDRQMPLENASSARQLTCRPGVAAITCLGPGGGLR